MMLNTSKASRRINRRIKRKPYRIWLFVPILTVLFNLSMLSHPLQYDKINTLFLTPVDKSSDPVQYCVEENLLPSDDIDGEMSVGEPYEFPAIKTIDYVSHKRIKVKRKPPPKRRMHVSADHSVSDNSSRDQEYFIQVGAWKNPEYANETLKKLSKLYPEARLIKQNDFTKLRISGIKTKEQGKIIADKISRLLHMRPLIVLKTHDYSLADAVRPFIGTSYGRIDCYGLLVRGLVNQGVRYFGRGGLRDRLESLALSNGLPENAYLTGEGLIDVAGEKVYSRFIPKVPDADVLTDRTYDDILPLLHEGLVLSFSMTSRGHTGIISKKDNIWTYINSGVIDNPVSSCELSKGVSEEFLKAEIKNWFALAAELSEPLTITLGQIDARKLKEYDFADKAVDLTAFNTY